MLRKNLDELDEIGEIGDWAFLNQDTHIAIRYGKAAFAGTVVVTVNGASGWQWNGDKDKPTLTPSILVKEG